MRYEILWRQFVGTGTEHQILNLEDGAQADSLAVGEVDGSAYRVHYQIECDRKWNLQRVHILDMLENRVVSLLKDEHNAWLDEEHGRNEALDGCTEVDIMITPFTNTLPIRRLNLEQGESREIDVAYIGLPDLVVSHVKQRYTCVSKNGDGGIYRYESLTSGFTADLRVDSDGLVVDYPGMFSMEAKRRLASG